jgi:hypothetical protein
MMHAKHIERIGLLNDCINVRSLIPSHKSHVLGASEMYGYCGKCAECRCFTPSEISGKLQDTICACGHHRVNHALGAFRSLHTDYFGNTKIKPLAHKFHSSVGEMNAMEVEHARMQLAAAHEEQARRQAKAGLAGQATKVGSSIFAKQKRRLQKEAKEAQRAKAMRERVLERVECEWKQEEALVAQKAVMLKELRRLQEEERHIAGLLALEEDARVRLELQGERLHRLQRQEIAHRRSFLRRLRVRPKVRVSSPGRKPTTSQANHGRSGHGGSKRGHAGSQEIPREADHEPVVQEEEEIGEEKSAQDSFKIKEWGASALQRPESDLDTQHLQETDRPGHQAESSHYHEKLTFSQTAAANDDGDTAQEACHDYWGSQQIEQEQQAWNMDSLQEYGTDGFAYYEDYDDRAHGREEDAPINREHVEDSNCNAFGAHEPSQESGAFNSPDCQLRHRMVAKDHSCAGFAGFAYQEEHQGTLSIESSFQAHEALTPCLGEDARTSTVTQEQLAESFGANDSGVMFELVERQEGPWQQFKDPATNSNYYYNVETRETTWLPPACFNRAQPATELNSKRAIPENRLPELSVTTSSYFLGSPKYGNAPETKPTSVSTQVQTDPLEQDILQQIAAIDAKSLYALFQKPAQEKKRLETIFLPCPKSPPPLCSGPKERGGPRSPQQEKKLAFRMYLEKVGKEAEQSLPQRIPLDKTPLVFGRIGSADVRLDADSHPRMVSKRHCIIHSDARKGFVEVVDLSSTNGTRVNGSRLRPQGKVEEPVRASMKDGDVLTLGTNASPVRYRLRVLPLSIF